MRFATLVLSLVLIAVLAGCEDSVDPIVGTDKVFSLYGVLQPRSDTQWIRIYPIEERLTPTAPESLAVTFTSTDLDNGTTRTWRDSLIQEDDGRYAHVFWSPFRVAYDRSYRLEATNEEGETAHADVDVPPNAALVLQEPEVDAARVTTPVLVDNDVPRLMHLEVVYHIQYDFNVGPEEEPTARVPLSYDGAQERVEDGWLIPISLSDDFETLRERLNDADLWNPQYGIVLRDMTLRLAVATEEWDPPEGEFDADVLVEPGTMSNVENGFGFIGAGYRLEEQWTPPIEILKEAGWTDPRDL